MNVKQMLLSCYSAWNWCVFGFKSGGQEETYMISLGLYDDLKYNILLCCFQLLAVSSLFNHLQEHPPQASLLTLSVTLQKGLS